MQLWLEAQALCLENVGDALDGLARLEESLEHYERSADLVRRLVSRDNEVCHRSTLGLLHEKMGSAHYLLGNLPPALKNQREALRIMRQLALEEPATLGWQEALAAVHIFIGEIMEAAHDLSAAYRGYVQAVTIRKKLLDLEPGSADRNHALFMAEQRVDELKLRLLSSLDVRRQTSRH